MSTPSVQEAAVSQHDGFKYWAFITYSHQDERWGRWLHQELETYKVPSTLVGRRADNGQVTPRRLLPIFRDREELPGAADLGGKIKAALGQSRYLIVICSPRSAVSRWVNEEVSLFKAMGRDDRVLCLIVDGEPNASEEPDSGMLECFPPAVRHRVDGDAQLTEERAEPVAADAREGKDGRTGAKFKLLAGILNVGYDELWQRERRRRKWQRVRRAGAAAALSLVAVLAYLGVADAGLSVPAGDGVRTLLDHYEMSVFRPVHSPAEISRTAAGLRGTLFDALARGRRSDGKIMSHLTDRSEAEWEVWSHSQALSALLGVPRHPAKPGLQRELRLLAAGLRLPFARGTPVEGDGLKYGWVAHPGDRETQAEPALWTVTALAQALGRPGLLTGAERRRAMAHLIYAQQTLRLNHPVPTGGWNMFPRQTDPRRHSVYTTALALLALLETREAGLPWEGSTARRDLLLRATAGWLVNAYDEHAHGWLVTSSGASTGNAPPDGLTLQLYAELLRAEREAGVTLSPAILRDIPPYLTGLTKRGPAYPTASGEFAATVTGVDGRLVSRREGVGFLWYPWAIHAAVEWLARARQGGVPTEERVRVRRALSHLVVDIGPSVVRKAGSGWTFEAAETLYGLSRVASPPPD